MGVDLHLHKSGNALKIEGVNGLRLFENEVDEVYDFQMEVLQISMVVRDFYYFIQQTEIDDCESAGFIFNNQYLEHSYHLEKHFRVLLLTHVLVYETYNLSSVEVTIFQHLSVKKLVFRLNWLRVFLNRFVD